MKAKKPSKPHPKAPKRLVKLWHVNKCNYYKTAKQLNIAASWVWQLIKFGKEPKRLDLRQKLFLTRKKSPEELEQIRARKKYDKLQVEREVDEHFKQVFETK